MNDEYRKMRDDELIERLGWALADIARLKETSKVVHLGAINVANLASMTLNIGRVKAELEKRQEQPHCASCSETENLTECRATPDSTYHLCPVCKRDEELS